MTSSVDKSKMQTASFLEEETITMAHGSGGKAMKDLIEKLFLEAFDNSELARLDDQARFKLSDLQSHGDRLAFTTDSYVVYPIFFNGGDIGKLAVSGTVNDLAVGGAKPLYLTCSMILEEGLPIADLRRVVQSIKTTAEKAGVVIVTGDTKVVERGAADKLYINTAGVGVIREGIDVSPTQARPGDVVLINGSIGDHGSAIVAAREDLAIESDVQSDCRPLNDLISTMLSVCPQMRCLRDATRGGLATVLNEFATASNVCIRIDESTLPLKDQVRGMCEILGFDPLYLANEGKIVAVAPPEGAERLLAAMRSHEDGRESAIIGRIVQSPEKTVIIETSFGGDKMLDMLIGDQLPRIC